MGRVISYGVGQYSGSAPTEGHAVVTDRAYVKDATRRGAIYLQGAGSVAVTDLNSGAGNSLADLGYPTISIDGGCTTSQATWGNSTGISRLTDAFTYFLANWGPKATKVGLYGISHGALQCLSWAVNNPAKVAWMYLVLPANDVQDIHDNRSAGLATVGLSPTSIETAYGGGAGYTAAMPASNPARSASSLAGIPTRLIYSSNDPIVDTTTVSALAAAIGSSCATVNTGANGHGTGGYTTTAADLAFFKANS